MYKRLASRPTIWGLRSCACSLKSCWKGSPAMKSELKARFERLGPIRDVDRVHSGSAVDLIIRPAKDLASIRTIDAVNALARRGMSLLQAKRAVERMIESGEASIHLSTVEGERELARELGAAGVSAAKVEARPVDVQALRKRLHMTQEAFARTYAVPLAVLQNWEQGRSEPDAAAVAYLNVIASRPDEAARALEAPLH